MKTKENLRKLLTENRWDELFTELEKVLHPDANWLNNVSSLKGRYNHLKKYQVSGVLSTAEEVREYENIRNSAQLLMDGVPKHETPKREKTGLVICILMILSCIFYIRIVNDPPNLNYTNASFYEPVFMPSDSALKILVMPFKQVIGNNEYNIDYMWSILDRFEKFRDYAHLPIVVKSYPGKLDNYVLMSESDIVKLSKLNNADIVIWGNYEELKDSPIIEIKYLLIKKIPENIIDDQGIAITNNINQLRKGKLLWNLENLVYWICALEAYNNSHYAAASNWFSKVQLDTMDSSVDPKSYVAAGEMFLSLELEKHALPTFLKAKSILESSSYFLNNSSSYTIDSTLYCVVYDDIAICYALMGQYSDALKLQHKSISICKAQAEVNDTLLASLYNDIACTYNDMGAYNYALPYNLLALSIRLKEKEPNDNLSIAYQNLGLTYLYLGAFTKAEKYLSQALKDRISRYGELDYRVAVVYNNLAGLYYCQTNLEKSLEYFKKAELIQIKRFGCLNETVAFTRNNIGAVLNDLGRYDESIMYLTEVLNFRESTLTLYDDRIAQTANNYARAKSKLKKYDEALPYHQKSILIRDSILPKTHPKLELSYQNYAETLDSMGEKKAATKYHRKATVIRSKRGAVK